MMGSELNQQEEDESYTVAAQKFEINLSRPHTMWEEPAFNFKRKD